MMILTLSRRFLSSSAWITSFIHSEAGGCVETAESENIGFFWATLSANFWAETSMPRSVCAIEGGLFETLMKIGTAEACHD